MIGRLTSVRNHKTKTHIFSFYLGHEYGIPFAFGRALGFNDSDLLRSRTYYNVYRVETQPAIDVARRIASKLKFVGQPGIAFYGDENYPVKTVGLGTGCICDPLQFMDLNMDLAIAIDDTVHTWTQTTFAEDTGRPLVVVNLRNTSFQAGLFL
ncbi:MAG: hypothetical protein KAS82_04890 [Bacteroidales bacterium]|nr:hypothetical protein [Bacteroidales bacterium]